MERIVLKHLSGSKAGQSDMFPLSEFKEILLGRDPSSTVVFDGLADTVVGRQHARITRNLALPSQFFITDLSSRNGTYVNGQRIVDRVGLKPGDVVQCGFGGPEFRFSIEPETEPLAVAPPPVPTADMLEQTRAQVRASNGGQSRRRLIVGGGTLMGLITLAAGIWFYRGLGASGSSEVGKSGPASQQNVLPNSGAGKYGHVHLSGGDTVEAEKDAQRVAWRIDVEPYLVLGSGRPGKAASDFDKPDGVAFSPAGLLFATDAKNRRIQVWDVKTGSHLAEFGHGVFGGEIVDIAIAPDSQVLITDQTLNLAYVFVPPQPGALNAKGHPISPYEYQFKGTRFGEQGFKKLGGIAIDSRGRTYTVDAHRNDVHRFNPDGKSDKTWKFEKSRADGDTYLHGCEGIAIDESAGNLFIASEKDAVIEVFDWETGAYKHQFVGAVKDAADRPTGKHVFFGSVEGLTIAQHHLLAVDESAGHIQIFDLSRPDAFNTDLAGYSAPQPTRQAGYQGFFGHAPLVDFEDKTNTDLQQQVKVGSIIPGQANPPGYFCSPDSIASYTDQTSGETYVAIADQCNYRLVVYRWSDIAKAMGATVTLTATMPAASNATPEGTPVVPSANKAAGAARNRIVASSRSTVDRKSGGASTIASKSKRVINTKVDTTANSKPSRTNITQANDSKDVVKGSGANTIAGKSKDVVKSNSDVVVSDKKAKKAKKEKKIKNKL